MPIRLSTTHALQKLESLLTLDNDPGFLSYAFCIEAEFIDLFAQIIERNAKRNNVIPFMTALIRRYFEQSVDQICGVLDQHKIDGVEIFSLMCEKNLIRNHAKKKLNKKLSGKAVKNLVDTYINAYNNWLLAGILWKAFVQSYDPDFKVKIIEDKDAKAPTEICSGTNYRPLWAMKMACLEAGDPSHGSGDEDIFIRPLKEW